MTITDEIYEAAAIAVYGGPYRDVANEVHLQALRDAVAAAAPLIEAARLRAFAEKLMGRRNEMDAPDVFSDVERHNMRGERRGLELAAGMARAATDDSGARGT